MGWLGSACVVAVAAGWTLYHSSIVPRWHSASVGLVKNQKASGNQCLVVHRLKGFSAVLTLTCRWPAAIRGRWRRGNHWRWQRATWTWVTATQLAISSACVFLCVRGSSNSVLKTRRGRTLCFLNPLAAWVWRHIILHSNESQQFFPVSWFPQQSISLLMNQWWMFYQV